MDSWLTLQPRDYDLVNLDSCVDTSNEEVSGIEACRSSEYPEGEHHDQGVAEVQQCGNEFSDFKLQEEQRNQSLQGTLLYDQSNEREHITVKIGDR